MSASGRDRDRKLTEEGEARTRAAGKALRKLDVQFDLVLSSPYTRAWRTAEIVVEELRCKHLLHVASALGSGEPAAGVLQEVARQAGKHQSILLVGHEPDLSHLASIYIAGTPRVAITMRKGSLCKVFCDRPEPGSAALDWLMTAEQMERIL